MRLSVVSLVALIATSGGASAQSVLERVLGQIDGASNLAQVNGTFANIAESVGAPDVVTTTTESGPVGFSNAPPETILWEFGGYGGSTVITVADLGTTWTEADITGLETTYGISSISVGLDGTVSVQTTADYDGTVWLSNSSTDAMETLTASSGAAFFLDPTAQVYWTPVEGGPSPMLMTAFVADDAWGLSDTDLYIGEVTTTTTIPGLATVIDGSITNLITGLTATTAEAIAGATTATEITLPTVDLGNLSTTVLGAVNTGDITLGVNSAVDEAGTTTTRAISAAVMQIGGAADTGALVLNVAHNASAVNGSIQNTMIAVNGSVGSASTTALGAVNTGTITSGVNAAVQGIVGMTGQASSGL